MIAMHVERRRLHRRLRQHDMNLAAMMRLVIKQM